MSLSKEIEKNYRIYKGLDYAPEEDQHKFLNIFNSLLVGSFLLALPVLLGWMIFLEYYKLEDSLPLTTEQQGIVNQRDICLAVNENPDCCSQNFTRKLKGLWGCR